MAQSVAQKAYRIEVPGWVVQRIARGLLAMPKATAALTTERVEQLQRMILEGTTTPECVGFAGRTWGVRRSQGYVLLKRAWQQIKNDINETGIDRQELLSWSIQTLMAAAGQAMQQKNPGAVVACIRQLDHMTGTGYNSHRAKGTRR